MAVFGDTLRQARAFKGVTLKEAEQATRINRHHLAALEEENFGVLPPLIYQRGIVRNYATYLDLDPSKLLTMFDEARGGEAAADPMPAVKPLDMPSHWAPNFAIIAFMVVMGAIVFAWVYSVSFAPEEETSTAAPDIPTVTKIPDTPLSFSPTPQSRASTGAPTATATRPATSTAVATSTAEPSATATATASAPTPVPEVETAPAAEVVQLDAAAPQQAPVQEEPAPQPGEGSALTFTAEADIYLSVTADGVPVIDGTVAAGQTVGPVYGSDFQVYTTNARRTLISVDGGAPFFMSYDEVEMQFPLSP